MPSPFPGMDPYLEDPRVWEDFHTTFLVALRATVKPLLPPDFVARLDERLYVVEWERRFRPDVTVIHTPAAPTVARAATATRPRSDTPPRVLRLHEETHREVFLEIRRLREPGDLIAVVELLSPANKANGRGREEYLRKQRDLLASPVHLIEIDLLRAGLHTLAPDREALEREYGRFDYLVSLHRAQTEPGYREFEVWPLTLRDRLPQIYLPLDEAHPDLLLDLQAVFRRAYDEGPTELLRYALPPQDPPAHAAT